MLKFLVPSFIKNIDKTLVLNYPFWYIVKLHYLLYFTIIMWLISYGVGCMLPIDITSYNPEKVTDIWIFVFSVLGVILFCVWMYYLTIYNNEDHFGKFSMWDDTKMLLILVIGINMLMSFSYPMQLRVKNRLANTFTDIELAQQYNDLNLGYKYITSDLEDFQYCGFDLHDNPSHDSIINRESSYYGKQYVYDLTKFNNFTRYDISGNNYLFYDISLFSMTPSLVLKDSIFRKALLSDEAVEKAYSLHTTDADKLKAISKHLNLVNLYNRNHYFEYTAQEYLDNYNHYEKNCTTYFPDAHNIHPQDRRVINYLPDSDVSAYIANIYKAKFTKPHVLLSNYLWFAFYFSFCVSLLIIVFRNNKWQHFLVSAVAFILLGIILGILSLAFGTRSSESKFTTLFLITWGICAVLSIQYYFKKNRYSTVKAVATNLFYICLPFMALIICGYAHDVFGWLKMENEGLTDAFHIAQREIMERTYEDALFLAQLLGIGVFVLVVMPLYKLFFAKQKALPREK